jgi:hypothetical protein
VVHFAPAIYTKRLCTQEATTLRLWNRTILMEGP